MGKYQAYPKYKDLGGEWFGDIPDHWVIYSSKRLFPESKKRAALEDLQLSATQDYGVISQERFMRLAGRRVVQLNSNQELRKRVDIGDFVISMRSFQGGLERAWEAGGIRSSYVVLKPVDGIVRGYFQYLFKSTRYVQALQSTANFIRDGQDMNYQNFILIDLPCPSVQEQHTISAFLDHETAKTDTLIDKQQQLIQLLKEKRQAVISHAVTKGLNPNAPMRDSGVEWLGKVPEHWSVTRIKYYTHVFEQGWSPQCDSRPAEDDEYGVLKVGCVNYGEFRAEENKALPIELEPQRQYSLKKGDLLISRANTKELVGSAAVVERDYNNLILCDKLYRLRFDEAVNPQLVAYFLSLFVVRQQIEIEATGASHSMQNIGQSTIKEMPVVIPPIEEANELVSTIKEQMTVFEALESKAVKGIKLLQERRTALISAAVTGKIDVRHHASHPTGNDTSEVSA